MKIKCIQTSSKGNAFIVYRENDTVLIDAGVKVEEPFDIMFITHLHDDHSAYFRKYAAKVKWTCGSDVYEQIKAIVNPLLLINYVDPEILGIYTFPVRHDVPCYGAVVRDGQEKYCHITDTDYFVAPEIAFNCEKYSIESNYSDLLIDATNRPDFINQRAKETHMSNEQAIALALELSGEKTKTVAFIHVSNDANSELYMTTEHETMMGGDFRIVYPKKQQVY